MKTHLSHNKTTRCGAKSTNLTRIHKKVTCTRCLILIERKPNTSPSKRSLTRTRCRSAQKAEGSKYNQYIHQVTNSKIPVCRYVRLAVERHLRDLKRKDLYFDTQAADTAITLVESMNYKKGINYQLTPAQAFDTAMIFGWKIKATKKRRFTESYEEMARKNGKSALRIAQGILFNISQTQAQNYFVATGREQTTYLLHTLLKPILNHTPWLNEIFEVYQTSASYPTNESYWKSMSRDSKKQDMYNPYFVLNDEQHAQPDSSLYDVMKTGQTAPDCHLATITTPGFDTASACYHMRTAAIAVLEGTKTNDSLYAIIYTLDDDDREKIQVKKDGTWIRLKDKSKIKPSSPSGTGGRHKPGIYELWELDESLWIKANPNLGIPGGISIEKLRREYISDKNKGGQTWVSFLTKRMSLWADAAKTWIPSAEWAKGNAVPSIVINRHPEQNEGSLIEPDTRLWFDGFDLSSNRDFTSYALISEEDEQGYHDTFVWNFIPADNLMEREKKDKNQYRPWIEAGWLHTTPGNWIDLNYIEEFITNIHKKGIPIPKGFLNQSDGSGVQRIPIKIHSGAFDNKFAGGIISNLAEAGFDFLQLAQNEYSLNEGTRYLEDLIMNKENGCRLRHGGNPCLAWQISNCVLSVKDAKESEGEQDEGYIKISKKLSAEKIDGPSAQINAITRMLNHRKEPDKTPGVMYIQGLNI